MFDDTESDYSHNSDSDDFDRVITPNISIEVDQFIRYLGNRSSPNYSGPGEVKFMQVGNKCKTKRGTFPFGEKHQPSAYLVGLFTIDIKRKPEEVSLRSSLKAMIHTPS